MSLELLNSIASILRIVSALLILFAMGSTLGWIGSFIISPLKSRRRKLGKGVVISVLIIVANIIVTVILGVFYDSYSAHNS